MSRAVPSGLGRLALPLLVCILVLLSAAEIWLLTVVAITIGVLPTLALLVAVAAVGAWLMRREGHRSWTALVEAYGTGRMPSGQLAEAALVLIGGIMLILPGFITDLLGLVCLLPWTRPLARRLIGMLIARQSRFGIVPPADSSENGRVIRGETIEDESPGPDVLSGEIED